MTKPKTTKFISLRTFLGKAVCVCIRGHSAMCIRTDRRTSWFIETTTYRKIPFYREINETSSVGENLKG